MLAGVAQEQGGGAVGVAAAGVQLGHAGEDRPGEVVPVQRAGGVGGEHRALGARQRREHGVLGQRVAPAQPAVRRRDEQAGVDRAPQGAGGRRRVGPGGRRQQVPRQVATEQGGDAHDVAVAGGEGGDAVGDGVGERLGHLGRQRARRVPAALAPHDRPRVGEAGRELLDQQRQPVGGGQDVVADGVVGLVAEHRARQGGGVGRGEAPEVHRRHPGAAQRRQALGRLLVGAHRAEHPDLGGREAPGEVLEDREGVAVGPVQVVEDHDRAPRSGDHPEQLADGLAEHQDGVDEVRAGPAVGRPRGPGGQEAGEDGPERCDPLVLREGRPRGGRRAPRRAGGRAPPPGTACPRSTRAPAAAARPATSSSSRVFPLPASPATRLTPPGPDRAAPTRTPSSSSRPTSGAAPARPASTQYNLRPRDVIWIFGTMPEKDT